MGGNRGSHRGKARRGLYVIGLAGPAGALLAMGLAAAATAPQAHADFDDLLQPIVDAAAQTINVVDPSLASSLDPGLLESLAPGLDVGGVAEPAAAAAAAENSTVALQMHDTSPLVDISVGGGPSIPVLADTGSEGLVVPWYDISLQNLFSLGSPITTGTVGYGGTLNDPNIEVFYAEYDETISFGNGLVTSPTPVELELFAYPASFSNIFNPQDWSFEGYEGSNGADGVLGLGNGVTPGPSVVGALPGDLSDGVLVNEPAGYLEFGPNPLPEYTAISGAPVTNLEVAVGGGGAVPIGAAIDSGGVYGAIPSDILGGATVGDQLSSGTEIEVYTSSGQFLYSYTAELPNSPTVTSADTMNTGWEAFQAYPIYMTYDPNGVGETVFDYQ
jgi:hypothetical protein